MSVGEETVECPLCMEQLEMDDINFFPCTCGYQICRFCWHRIRTDENGLCPACRKQYPEDPAEFKPLTDDELQRIKKERKQKDLQRKQKAAENRKHLANVRVVQKNLVFVVGLSTRLADPEVLKKHEYFGKFGKIHKVVINQSTSYAGSQGPSASAYVTYHKMEDALKAIQAVNNVYVDGRTLKASLGTTKYCSHFLKGAQCLKSDCMYLHELGEECASFTKDEMQHGKHQEYEQKLHENYINSQNTANNSTTAWKTTQPGQPAVTRKKTASPTEESQQQQPQLQQQQQQPPQPQHSPPLSNHLQQNNEAWPSLQSKTEKITNGNKSTSSTPPPTVKPELSHNRAPGNHRPTTNGMSQSAPPVKPTQIPTDQKISLPPQPVVAPHAIGSNRKHLFGDPVNADSLFGNSGFPTHRNPNKPNIIPTVPTPHSTEPSLPNTEIPDTIPVSSSTDWQAAFGFGSSTSAQTTSSNDDDLGFDPWDESSKALADLIEKETLINPYANPPQRHPPGFQMPPMPTFTPGHLKTGEPVGGSKMLGLMQYTHAEVPLQNNAFRDMLSDSRHKSSQNTAPQNDPFNAKDWQDGLKALLPNINISFGAPPTPSRPIQQHNTHNGHPLSESPPHWMRSLQQLTESDTSTANHRLPFVQQFQLRGTGWPTQSQTPPPGFGAPLRPTPQTTEPQIAQGLK